MKFNINDTTKGEMWDEQRDVNEKRFMPLNKTKIELILSAVTFSLSNVQQ